MDDAARRAIYVHKAAKVSDSFTRLFTFALMLYPTTLGFLMASRLGAFSLLIPTPTIPGAPSPLHGRHDLWDADERGSLVRAGFAYVIVFLVHILVVFVLIIHGAPGAWKIKRTFSWIAPMILWACTSGFCFHYATLARYGARAAEWVVATAVCTLLFFATVMMVHCGWHATQVMDEEDDPQLPPAAQAVG